MEKSKTQKPSEQPTPHQRFYTVKNISRIQAGIPHGTGLAVKFVNHNLGKAPPGHSRSPGTPRGHPPEGRTGPPERDVGLSNEKNNRKEGFPPNRTAVKSEKEGMNNNNKEMKHYKHLNFSTMKKQILFLMVFVLAAFAGINKSYGQCTADALHPAAGVVYHYTTTVLGSGYSGTGTYEWYVTTNPDIKAKDKKVLADGLFSAMSGETTADVAITWTSAAVALAKTTPIYVALWYSETNSVGTCVAENVRALQIAPVNTFLLAIEPTNATGTTLTPNVCAADVVSALVDHPADVSTGQDNTNASMHIVYGTNTLYYKITASGVNSNWKPQVRIPALTAPQAYTSIDWSADGGSTWTNIGSAAGDITLTSDYAATVAGTDYILRLVINQNEYESLADQILNVAVDGTLAPGYTINDIKSATDCTDEAIFGKKADGTILARPTITPGVPAFMTKNP